RARGIRKGRWPTTPRQESSGNFCKLRARCPSHGSVLRSGQVLPSAATPLPHRRRQPQTPRLFLTQKAILMLVSVVLFGLGLGFVGMPHTATPTTLKSLRAASSTEARADRVVFLAGGLSEEKLLCLSAALAASRHPGVLLLDSPSLSPYLKDYFQSYRPQE